MHGLLPPKQGNRAKTAEHIFLINSFFKCSQIIKISSNLAEYFSPSSYLPIDIHDADASISAINKAIEQDIYSCRNNDIAQARLKVLNDYNLFALLAEEFANMNPLAPKRVITIKSDTSFVDLKKIQVMLVNRMKHKIFK